jgi:hypothetical protein
MLNTQFNYQICPAMITIVHSGYQTDQFRK